MSFQTVIEQYLRVCEDLTTSKIQFLATEFGHLLAERTLRAEEARQLRLGLLKGSQTLPDSDRARTDVLVNFLSAYEASRTAEESHEAKLDEIRNGSGQVWRCAAFGEWRIITVRDDMVQLQGPAGGLCRAFKKIPLKEFAMFWERIR